MKWPNARISFNLVAIAIVLVFIGLALQLLPGPEANRLEQRQLFAEQVAIACRLAMERNESDSLASVLDANLEGKSGVRSAIVIDRGGKILATSTVQPLSSGSAAESNQTADLLRVPIQSSGEDLGTLELRFAPIQFAGLWRALRHPTTTFVLFFGSAGFLAFFLFLSVLSRQMGLSSWRAETKAALLDVGDDSADSITLEPASGLLPVDQDGSALLPIPESWQELEKSSAHLKKLLQRLHQSREEIRRQNQQLLEMATKDPLTGCLNRRAFFTEFESHWSAAQRYGHTISCIMLDVDHFKSVNDLHGHSTGDVVLQQIAATLQEKIRQCDFLCRYGGEEFCILLPYVDVDEAAQAAARLRRQIAERRPANLPITASFGVSSRSLGAKDSQGLIDQADTALYVAKRLGRNRVVRWDEVPANQTLEKAKSRNAPPAENIGAGTISFHAVTALFSALVYRHAKTAEHSRRVADWCVAAASDLLSHNECYVLEVAALLHDIGKLGVPDAILLKPGALTADEWKIIRTHETIGQEIVAAAFSSPQLTQIIRFHHCHFAGDSKSDGVPRGKDLPIGARFLAIADAFDSMVSDQVYRKGMSRSDAFAELRRCAGKQFDPELVEHFIKIVMDRDSSHSISLPSVDKENALQMGLHLEKLAIAADVHDRTTLIEVAGSLHTMAKGQGIVSIAKTAAQLKAAAESGKRDGHLTELTMDLIELCRSTKQAPLPDDAGQETVNS